MKIQRVSRVLVVLLATVALASFGCKKDEGKAEEAGGGEKSGKAVEKGASKSSSTKTAFAVFPEGADFVLGLNGDSLRGSGLWKKFSPMLEGQLAKEKEFQVFKDTCGFDPISKIESVIIGGSMEGEDGVVVVKGFKRGEVKECAEKMAKKEGEKLSIEEDGKLMKVAHDSEVMWFAWLDDSTVVTGSGAEGEGGKAWVEGRMGGQAGLDKNKEMMGLLGQVDSAGTVWFIAKPKDPSKMAMMGPPPSAMFGTVLLTSGLKIDMGLRYAKPEEAKGFVDQTTQMMGAMASDPTTKMIADKSKLEAKGNDAIIKLDLNEEELGKVIAMVQQMAGPMLGGMMQ